MGVYDDYPRGVYLVGSHKVTDPAKLRGADFAVAHLGSGMKRTANFTDHIQAAHDAGIPLIAYYENDPETFVVQYQSLNLDHWLKNPMDNYLIKDVIAPSLLSGGVKREVHAVIIGMNKLIETSGKTIPEAWVLDCARFMKKVIEQTWGIPVFFYIDPEKAEALTKYPGEGFETFLGGKNSYGQYNLSGISTYLNAYGPGSVAASWSSLPVPDDGFPVKLRQMKMDTGLGNAKGIEFLCYSAGKFTLAGIDGNTVPLWLWFGTKAGLYDRLKFFPAQPDPEPEPEPDPGEDPEPDPGEDPKPNPEDPEPEPGEDEDPEPGDAGLLWGAIYKGLDAFSAAWLKGRGLK